MKDRPGELDVAEMTGTFGHTFTARLALEVAVDGPHPGVHETADLGFPGGLVHDLGMLDFGYRVRFLQTHDSSISEGPDIGRCMQAHYLFRREDTELNLPDLAHGRGREGELMTKHGWRLSDTDGSREKMGEDGVFGMVERII
jgi:hypothetical protein